MTNRQYPWLAQVYRKIFLNRKRTKTDWYSSGGVIVTNIMILTCGSCVCDEPYDFKKGKFINADKHINDGKPNYYCSMDSKDGPANQNRKGENEVYYSIG